MLRLEESYLSLSTVNAICLSLSQKKTTTLTEQTTTINHYQPPLSLLWGDINYVVVESSKGSELRPSRN